MKKSKLLIGGLLMSGMLAFSGCESATAEKPGKEVETEKEQEEKEEVKEEAEEEVKEEVKEEAEEDQPSVTADEDLPEETISDEDGPEEEIDEEDLAFLYEQYYDIISGLDEKWDQFMFVYFDNDSFPDVFISSTEPDMNDLKEYKIITRSRAGAELNEGLADGVAGAGGYRGTLYYVPQSGILYEITANAPLNNPGSNIYLLDDGHLNLYATGYTEVTDDYTGPDDYDHMTWFWNNEEVTHEEYEKKLNEETLNQSGDALSSLFYVDRESMLNRLSKQMNR
ncbi:MAG: hypothetical protein J6X66_05415 [Lachnospiraceae bacterium]|nr:hypothetical protein [Lachnospiraceae bacterium]